jgi:hypothetical protein
MQSKLLFKSFFALFIGVSLLGVCAEAQTKKAKNKTAEQGSDKIIYEPDADLLREMRGKVSVRLSKKDWAQFNRQSPVVNPKGTRSAYVAQFKIDGDTDNLMDVIVVNEKPGNKFYEIRGFDDFPWRPFDEIRWINNDVLQFEQWVNPHNGGRYRINLKTGKVVAAGYVRSN